DRRLSRSLPATSFASCLHGKKSRRTIRWKVPKVSKRSSSSWRASKHRRQRGKVNCYQREWWNTIRHGSTLCVCPAKWFGRDSLHSLVRRLSRVEKELAARVRFEILPLRSCDERILRFGVPCSRNRRRQSTQNFR